MSYYVIAQDHHDGFLILSAGPEGVIAFETVEEAQDFSDQLDEPGEFEVIPYDPTMGPLVLVV